MKSGNSGRVDSVNTRTLIMNTFIDLLTQYPMDKITVNSITKKCDISRQTFYIYFTDKFELLQTIYKEEFDEAVKHANDTSLTYGDVWYRLLMRRRKFYLHAFDVHGYCSLSSFLVDLHHKRATEIIRKTGLVLNEKQRIRGKILGRPLLAIAGRTVGTIVLVAVLGLLLQTFATIGNLFVRAVIACAVIVACFWMQLVSGGEQGERDVTFGSMLQKRMADGYVPTAEERAKCYAPLRALLGALLGALPFVLCALVVAAVAQPYTYALQDMPSWMSAYAYRADVYAPLNYYSELGGATLPDYLRIVVRACNMIYLLPFGNSVMYYAFQIDRLGPVLLLILPLGYALGYLRGHALHVNRLAYNAQAKAATLKKIKRKKKREQAARRQREKERKGPEQLI